MPRPRKSLVPEVVDDATDIRGKQNLISKMLAGVQEPGAADVAMPSEDMLRPPAKIESSEETDFMTRVLLSIHEEHVDAAKKDRQPNIQAALERCGCALPIYLQMTMNPDFMELAKKVYRGFTVIPRMPKTYMAATKAAEAGDVAAMRLVKSFTDETRTEQEERLRSLQMQGGDALKRELMAIIKRLSDRLASAELAVAPDDFAELGTDEIERDEQQVFVSTIDHAALCGQDAGRLSTLAGEDDGTSQAYEAQGGPDLY